MDTRSDRGQFYPGGATSGEPVPGGGTDKVDRVDVGEIGASYTLKDVKNKVNQIVRVLAPAAVGCLVLIAGAATGVLEDLPNTASVVTNEEDAVALATLATATNELNSSFVIHHSSLSNRLDSATNALDSSFVIRHSSLSNFIVTTYAKLSDIPAQPDLAPYALKSELPQDYLTENDITNFATRTWIAAQGYASGADMTARLDVQDLAIAAASNALWAAHLAEAARLNAASNALATAHAADVAALRTGTNRLDQAWRAGTNALAQTHLADIEALDAKIGALELTGGMTRLWSGDATTYQDATGVVWQVSDGYGPWTADTNIVAFQSWSQAMPEIDPSLYCIYFAVNGTNAHFYTVAPGATQTNQLLAAVSWTWDDWLGDDADAAKFDFSFIRHPIPGMYTNAVDRVAYTNELRALSNALDNAIGDLGGRLSIDIQANAGNIEELQLAIPAIGPAATNYTDAATNALAHALPQGSWLPATEGIGGTFTVTTNVWFDNGLVGVAFYSGLDVYNHISLYGGTAGWISAGATVAFDDAASLSFGGTNIVPFIGSFISTNNAAFVTAVTNCPVVIAAADGVTLGDFGEYGTLGSLLAALAAAITWLKTNKANGTDLPYEIHAVTITSGAGTLADRAVNTVTLSADATLTLPAAVVVGGVSKVRDLLVDLTVSGTPLPDVTFAGATGETVTFVAEGDSSSAEFAVPSAAGEWLYSFTEISAGKFAVALKQVSAVSQGGGA